MIRNVRQSPGILFCSYDCPAGQMMILPYGKNDDAPCGRNDDMSPANVPKALIIREAIIMRVSAHHVPRDAELIIAGCHE